MGFGAQLGMQAATGAVGGIMGLALAGINDRRQLKQQQKLQDMQIAGNKQMTDYQYQKQLQMWKDTSYSAQRAELEKAGLNPALLYGMSGGGGQTTGAGAASVGGAQAPAGGGEYATGMGLMMQQAMTAAQIENIKSQTEKNKAEAAKTAGVDTQLGETQVKSLTQGIENQKAVKELTDLQAKLARIEAYIKGDTADEQIHVLERAALQSDEVLERMVRENWVDNGTKLDRQRMVRVELIGMGLKNILTTAQTENTRQSTEESKSRVKLNDAQIKSIAENLMMGWDKMTQENRRIAVAEQLKDWATEVPRSVEMVTKMIDGIVGSAVRPPANVTNLKVE